MSALPIRARLTAWYVLVLAALLVGLGAFVVVRLRADLTETVDRGLGAATAQLATGYREEGVPEFVDVAASVLPTEAGEAGAQLLDGDGRVLAATGADVATPLLDAAERRRVAAGGTIVRSVRLGTPAAHVRLRAVPVRVGDRTGVVVAAESLREVDEAVTRVLTLLLLGGGASLAAAAVGGWWIARRGLTPVGRMASRAAQIDIGALSDRIPVPPADDELRHLARTLNAMLDRLENGVVVRERLIADASHELRGPLATMRAELEVSLLHDRVDGAARAVLRSTHDEVLRMGRIVENLLTLARADGDRLDLLRVPTGLRDIAERTVGTYRAAASSAGVALTVTGADVVVVGDADRLRQVVGNLLDNALRVAPPGTAVEVRSWGAGSRAGITVTDEGPGVPADARERIFARFAREDPARGRSGGAGLGLAICAEIVRAHGGTIDVTDGPTGGSAFTVTLAAAAPLSRSSAARNTLPSGAHPHHVASPPARRPRADHPPPGA